MNGFKHGLEAHFSTLIIGNYSRSLDHQDQAQVRVYNTSNFPQFFLNFWMLSKLYCKMAVTEQSVIILWVNWQNIALIWQKITCSTLFCLIWRIFSTTSIGSESQLRWELTGIFLALDSCCCSCCLSCKKSVFQDFFFDSWNGVIAIIKVGKTTLPNRKQRNSM